MAMEAEVEEGSVVAAAAMVVVAEEEAWAEEEAAVAVEVVAARSQGQEVSGEAIGHATTVAKRATLPVIVPVKCLATEEQGVAGVVETATVTTAVKPDILHETVALLKPPLRAQSYSVVLSRIPSVETMQSSEGALLGTLC